jgi:hypothetical protein
MKGDEDGDVGGDVGGEGGGGLTMVRDHLAEFGFLDK